MFTSLVYFHTTFVLFALIWVSGGESYLLIAIQNVVSYICAYRLSEGAVSLPRHTGDLYMSNTCNIVCNVSQLLDVIKLNIELCY